RKSHVLDGLGRNNAESVLITTGKRARFHSQPIAGKFIPRYLLALNAFISRSTGTLPIGASTAIGAGDSLTFVGSAGGICRSCKHNQCAQSREYNSLYTGFHRLIS